MPNGVWIDEQGVIVRPAEPSHPGRNEFTESFRKIDVSTLPPEVAEVLVEARKIRSDPEGYVAMLRDWAEHGSASRYALSPDEVVRRSRPRGMDEATAAAHFELGEHLHTAGDHAAAIPHWREAHRLDPDNWTYKRQAWTFATTPPGEPSDLLQGPNDLFDGNWLDDVRRAGAENYYEPFEA